MKGKVIGYWIATVIVAGVMGAGGVGDFLNPPPVRELMGHLGYPVYVAPMLGVWKVLGTIILLAPGLPRLKEWAYAGMAIDLIGASVSHFASGDGPDKYALPVVFLLVLAASSALRPASRIMGQLFGSPSAAPAAPSSGAGIAAA